MKRVLQIGTLSGGPALMAYLLDSNVFIEAKNRYYGIDFCPAFWDWLIKQNANGSVYSIEEVGDELTEGNDALADWAKGCDDTSPVEYWKEGDRYMARYADGVKLVIRKGLRFGSCPVRFEGDEGWVETGDSGSVDVHPRSLRGEREFVRGYGSRTTKGRYLPGWNLFSSVKVITNILG